ncbi:MAG: hypothetical protein M3R50_10440 [Bacteroidota bacterium]|nr:hypothetical protein [Bacteroidota bacterium]
MAVKAYSEWKPGLALQYVKNILRQDSIDGLAFQRYSRKKQDGQGDDILSGNSLAVVGLYQSIYGFNPLYNRFYLNPHITEEISGSRLNYNYRGERLIIGLNTNGDGYTISNKQFTIAAKNDFGFFSKGSSVLYFNKDNPSFSIKAEVKNINHLKLAIIECNSQRIIWEQTSEGKGGRVHYTINNLKPGSSYSIYADSKLLKKIKSDGKGSLSFNASSSAKKIEVVLQP